MDEMLGPPDPVKLRRTVTRSKVVRMRNRGERVDDIAKATGLSRRGVEWHLTKAKAAGLLVDATEMIDVFVMPKAIDTYMEVFDQGDLEMRERVASKVFAGRGVLKSHNRQESTNQTSTTLTIHIDQATDRDTKDIAAIMGEVVGVPRRLAAPPVDAPVHVDDNDEENR